MADDTTASSTASSDTSSAGGDKSAPLSPSAGDMGAAPHADVAAPGPSLLSDLRSEFAALEQHFSSSALTLLKEAGNKGITAMEAYAVDEFKSLQGQHQAVFTDLHNKLAGFVASLEAIFHKG